MYYWTPSANIYLIYLKTLSLSTLEHENLWTRTVTQLCARLLEWNMVPNHLLNVLSLRLCRINPVLCLLKDLAYLPHSLFSLITFISWSKTQRTLYRLVIQLKYVFELCFHKWLLSSIFSLSHVIRSGIQIAKIQAGHSACNPRIWEVKQEGQEFIGNLRVSWARGD